MINITDQKKLSMKEYCLGRTLEGLFCSLYLMPIKKESTLEIFVKICGDEWKQKLCSSFSGAMETITKFMINQ